MKNEIDISVVVTVYNLEKYIGDCLDSILKQTGVDFEVICVNDQSTDKSLKILQEYQMKDHRVRIINNNENIGLASSRNKGILEAVGQYIHIMDGDDMLADGALSTMYTVASKNNLDLLGFSADVIFENEKLHQRFGENGYIRHGNYPNVKNGKYMFVSLRENGDPAVANIVLYAIRREFYIGKNLFMMDGLVYGDDSMFEIYMAADRVMIIPDMLYIRRYRENSAITSVMNVKKLEGLVSLFIREMNAWERIQNSISDNKVVSVIEKYFDHRLHEINVIIYELRNDLSTNHLFENQKVMNYFFRRFLQGESLYSDLISFEMINEIKSIHNVFLWGTGFYASQISRLLENENIRYRVVETKRTDKYFRNTKVECIEDIDTPEQDTMFIIAVSRKYYSEIKRILELNRYKKIFWI